MAGNVAAMSEELLEAVTALADAAERVNAAARGMEGLDWQVAANVLAILRKITAEHIGPLDASLTRHLYLKAPHGETELDGVGVMVVQRSKDRKAWDARSGVHAYVDAKITGTDGEVPPPWEVIDLVLEAAGIAYLKVTALRAVGLRSEDYCTEEPGKPSVRFM